MSSPTKQIHVTVLITSISPLRLSLINNFSWYSSRESCSPSRNAFQTLPQALPSIKEKSFSEYFDWLGQYNVVLLGDASHRTSEFYQARAEISKRLVKEHGFMTLALEADWPDAEAIDHHVRGWPQHSGTSEAKEVPFERFRTLMWRNKEMVDFVHWLREHNDNVTSAKKTGVFGLDLYSMSQSMNAVIQYLKAIDPEMAQVARERYGRLQPWVHREHEYGLKTFRLRSCDEDVIKMLLDLLRKRLEYSARIHDGQTSHSAGTERKCCLRCRGVLPEDLLPR